MCLADDRATGTLEFFYRCVGIKTYNEAMPLGACTAEGLYVSGVQYVEHTVGEYYSFLLLFPLPAQCGSLVEVQYFFLYEVGYVVIHRVIIGE